MSKIMSKIPSRNDYQRRVFDSEDHLFQAKCLNQALICISESINLEHKLANMLSVVAQAQADHIEQAEEILYGRPS